ncbi:MAG: DUF952 domain-containing protein [Paracoccus sp. (in: a-proteobacteria)]|uniref:DUF952 domain-containing protein n=1 Tax=Paracoccus sp. TaxID=267 RepID=UPI00391B79BF
MRPARPAGLDPAPPRAANAAMLIYKILRAPEWQVMQSQGRTRGAPVDLADGYIHFSTAEQVPGTLSRHFAAETGLMLLACDAEAMAADLRWEPARNGALFPHLYRDLRMADLRWSRAITQGPDGPETGDL